MEMDMTDNFGRTIDYLRISVTDKCNLRCQYCMPPHGVELIPHDELLSLEEIYRLVRILAETGLKKVRITGGEPLVRKNIGKLISDINSIPEIEEIAMTTNGILLPGRVKELKSCGLTSVNISLDTQNPDTFKKITGFEALGRVLGAIDEVLENGIRCKINCVPCREFNDGDLVSMAGIALEKELDVRFIELMPVGCGRDFHGVASDEILARLEAVYGKAVPCNDRRGNGPAEYWSFQNFKGKIGFISPISHKFCSECNRVRLTAGGMLKLCLNYNYGFELKPLLRSGAADEEIKNAVLEALKGKPMEHDFENVESDRSSKDSDFDERKMVQIGG